jgi:hypothetical protein
MEDFSIENQCKYVLWHTRKHTGVKCRAKEQISYIVIWEYISYSWGRGGGCKNKMMHILEDIIK